MYQYASIPTDGVDGEDDNVEGWVDEQHFMTETELDELDESVEPVWVLLMKASQLANTQSFNQCS